MHANRIGGVVRLAEREHKRVVAHNGAQTIHQCSCTGLAWLRPQEEKQCKYAARRDCCVDDALALPGDAQGFQQKIGEIGSKNRWIDQKVVVRESQLHVN